MAHVRLMLETSPRPIAVTFGTLWAVLVASMWMFA